MRFSDTGYYIERYVKCDNCGVLIYDDGVPPNEPARQGMLFCSAWCREWKSQRLAGNDMPKVPLRSVRE